MRRLDIHMRDSEALDTVIRAVKAAEPIDYYVVPLEQQDRKLISVFLRDNSGQALMDNVQTTLEDERDWRVSLHAIEATAPKIEERDEEDEGRQKRRKQALREEIYTNVEKGAKLDRDFLIMVILSTIVAAAGLNADSAAGVIGAMVIAPLLGPILGFSFGAALGDRGMIFGSGKTLIAGVALALVASVAISLIIPVDLESRELMSRAEVRLDGMALAIAAGCAAALSMAKGQSSALVGVMVAAALLPPGAAVGLFLGSGEGALASRAALLLALNVASLVFAALIVFRLRKIRPRGWLEQKDANRAVALNMALSVIFLAICVALILILDLGAKVSIG
ncbi:MAG: TIGR00341 family protein [Pseudomonadota bacterium]